MSKKTEEIQSKYFINGQPARDYNREFPGVPNTYKIIKEAFESKKYKNRFYKLKMKKIINYIQSSFSKWIDFKTRASRFEFFVGLATSGIFFLFNAILFMKLNSYATFLRDMTLPLVSYFYILIVILFTFIQCHSLFARRLNDISVNPYFSFIPFLLASSYLIFKSFFNIDSYGKLIFICILSVISICITLMVSESD